MATIATAQFSSDTDDESATMSDTSSDDELDDTYENEEEKAVKQNIEAVKSVVGAMVEKALVALEHVPTVSGDYFFSERKPQFVFIYEIRCHTRIRYWSTKNPSRRRLDNQVPWMTF